MTNPQKLSAREFGDLGPIRRVLEEIELLEGAQYTDDVARALADVRKKLAGAISEAEHPELMDGLTTKEYADIHKITRAAVYKRISRGQLPAKRKPGIGYVISAA